MLSPHKYQIPNVKPPLEYLEKHIIKDDGPGHHWFWRDTRRNHEHDLRGQALLKWKVKPTHKTDFVSKGSYCVTRLMIEYLIGPIPKYSQYHCMCRLPQCVNPHHWMNARASTRFRFACLDGVWQVVNFGYQVHIERMFAARVRGRDGVVHVVGVLPPDQQTPGAPFVATCGTVIAPETSLIVDEPVSCKGGC